MWRAYWHMVLEKLLRALCPDLQAGSQREGLDLAWAFETSKPIRSDILQPTRPLLLILLIQFYSLQSIEIHEPRGPIHIQTTTETLGSPLTSVLSLYYITYIFVSESPTLMKTTKVNVLLWVPHLCCCYLLDCKVL